MRALWELYGSFMGAIWELYRNFIGALWEFYGSFIGALWELYGSFMGAKRLQAPELNAHYREIKILEEHLHRQTSTVKVFIVEAL